MIYNLQVLRAFSALSVVFCHTGYLLNGIHTDFLGVAIFFVISGFIMTHISRKSVDGFLLRRMLRIIPLYWVCTISFVVLTHLGMTNPLYRIPVLSIWISNNPFQILTWLLTENGLTNPDNSLAILKSLLFIPYDNGTGSMFPILGVGWTLNLEMFYYCLFAISLRVHRGLAPVLVSVVLIFFHSAAMLLGNQFSLLTFYGQGYLLYFVLGIVTYYIWRSIPDAVVKNNQATVNFIGVCTVLIVVLFFIMRVAPTVLPASQEYGWIYDKFVYICPGLLVLMALLCHTAGYRTKWNFGILLGDASYALYLTHSIIVETVRSVGEKIEIFNSKNHFSVVFGILLISILFAIVVHVFIEIPLCKALRQKFKSKIYAERVEVKI